MGTNKKGKRLLKISIVAVFAISLGLNLYSFNQNIELANQYESLMCITSQLDSTNTISFITSLNINRYKDVEIFDINKGEVVKKVQSNDTIQNEVKKYLESIEGKYEKAKPLPSSGKVIKVPLEPEIRAESYWLTDEGVKVIDKVFIIFPDQEKPFLLVLNDDKLPVFFSFSANTEVLLQELNK